jgi:hypothetical protein
VESRSDLLTLYLQYSTSKVQTANMPYHVINGWTYLSIGLSEAIELPREPRPLGTNIYSITIGRSSSGKDEARATPSAFVRELYPNDDPDIGANHSREALIETLIERTDRVTFLQSNEADGLISTIKQGGYSTGIVQYWTLSYDGEVPSLGRVGRKELNKPGMHAIPIMHLIGTPVGMLKAVDRDMFYGGWLARNIWVIGEDVETTQISLRSKFTRAATTRSFDGVPKFFGSHLAMLRQRLRGTAPLEQKRAWMVPTDEAIEMVDAAKWNIHQHVTKEHDQDLWKPVLRRMGDIIWKIAALSAASAGRTIVSTRDVEVALYYAETWIGNVIIIADRISDTYFSKQCDDIEAFIASREGQDVELGAIYRFRKGEIKRVVDDYLQSLIVQGRVEEYTPKENGPRRYRIKVEKRSA